MPECKRTSTLQRADDLVAAGAKRTTTLAAARRADVVITMLGDDAAVERYEDADLSVLGAVATRAAGLQPS